MLESPKHTPQKIKLESNKGRTFSPKSQLIPVQSTHLMVKPTIVIFTPTPKMNKVPQKTPSFVIYHHVSELLTFSFQGYPPCLFHHFFPGLLRGFARTGSAYAGRIFKIWNEDGWPVRWRSCSVLICYIYNYKHIYIYFKRIWRICNQMNRITCVNMIKSVQM